MDWQPVEARIGVEEIIRAEREIRRLDATPAPYLDDVAETLLDTLSKLIDDNQRGKYLNRRWPTEFDTKRMVKATRMPLGFSAKMYVQVGGLDRNGKREFKKLEHHRS